MNICIYWCKFGKTILWNIWIFCVISTFLNIYQYEIEIQYIFDNKTQILFDNKTQVRQNWENTFCWAYKLNSGFLLYKHNKKENKSCISPYTLFLPAYIEEAVAPMVRVQAFNPSCPSNFERSIHIYSILIMLCIIYIYL